jgi:hypothetical protein
MRPILYNYFRDYDPAIGRYLESDPVGVKGLALLGDKLPGMVDFAMDWYALHASAGPIDDRFDVDYPELRMAPLGITLYGYVDASPLAFIDVFGLTKADKWFGYGNDKGFRDWWHNEKRFYGIEDIPNREVCDNLYKDYLDERARNEASGKGRKSGKGGRNRDDDAVRRLIRRGGGGKGGGARGSE